MTFPLKQVLSFLLTAVFLFQIFSSAIILTDYYLNKDYITKVYCINKDKPQMHCNGKCHLNAQLQKEEKKEQSPVNMVKVKIEIQLFSQPRLVFDFTNPVVTHKVYQSYPVYFSQNHLSSIFHPPQC